MVIMGMPDMQAMNGVWSEAPTVMYEAPNGLVQLRLIEFLVERGTGAIRGVQPGTLSRL